MLKSSRTVLLALAILLPTLSVPGSAQDSFENEARQDIAEKERQIAQRRQEQKEQQQQAAFTIAELNTAIATDEEIGAALDQINVLVAAAEARLDAVELSLANARTRMQEAQDQADALTEEVALIREQMGNQTINIYLDLVSEQSFLLEDGDPNRSARRQYYAEVLGASYQSLIDRLNKAEDDRQLVVQQIEEAQIEIEQAQIEIERDIADLNQERVIQESIQAEWNQRRDNLEVIADIERQAGIDLENEIAGLNQDIQDIEDEVERQAELVRIAEENRLRQENLARLAELERLQQQNSPDAPGGSTVPPAPVLHTPVSGAVGSGFGNRVHPIFGTVRFHAGLDFDGHNGDPVEAAASGTVTQAQNRDGYGNTVIIDHGGGWTTLYAHLSAFDVSRGDEVDIGQVIGRVGSTGWSTGPHLHFEIRYLGSARNPSLYL